MVRRKDAESFVHKHSMIREKQVLLDEWIFAFSKLLFEEKLIFNKFMDDYRLSVENKGPFVPVKENTPSI